MSAAVEGIALRWQHHFFSLARPGVAEVARCPVSGAMLVKAARMVFLPLTGEMADMVDRIDERCGLPFVYERVMSGGRE